MSSEIATLGILAAGIIVVIGGVLVARLHAFLALLLGALTVGLLTPRFAVERHSLQKTSFDIIELRAATGEIVLDAGGKNALTPRTVLLALKLDSDVGQVTRIGDLIVDRIESIPDPDGGQRHIAIARPFDDGEAIDIQQADVVVTATDRTAATNLAGQTVPSRIASAFGSTCGQIGILIAMASIIGKCLLDSGAADRVVRSSLKIVGESGAGVAFILSGFLLGIPVFFDTVFYLMIPLGKALRMRTGRNYLLYVLCIVAGATMAHSLVPPTPGPLFVAEQLGVDIGLMILVGSIVGLFASAAGYLYAMIANRLCELPLRESPDCSLDELQSLAQKDDADLPSLWLSALPILLPIILIAGYTVLKSLKLDLPDPLMRTAATLGDKNMALLLAAGIAMGTLIRQKRTHLRELTGSIQAALASGGVIILITAGGGAFGGILQQTGVANLIQSLPLSSPIVIVTLAFLITTAIRTAQGSATVAMITAVGILAGLGDAQQLGFHPVYLATAIGAGSKPIAWMNDSGFWVIGKMSGMTEGETLKFVTPMTVIMGLVGLLVTILGVTFFPMV